MLRYPFPKLKDSVAANVKSQQSQFGIFFLRPKLVLNFGQDIKLSESCDLSHSGVRRGLILLATRSPF